MIDGVQAEYVRIPHADNSLHKIPDNIDDETAVLLSDILPTGHEIGVHGVKVDFEIQKLWIKNLTITTGLVNTNTTPMLLKSVSSDKFELKKMITHRFTLDEVEHAYQVFLNGAKEKAMKVIISNG